MYKLIIFLQKYLNICKLFFVMKVIQIDVGGFDNNFSYLVVGENNEAILIDATGNKEAIEEEIQKNNLKVTLQLITHRHPDHTEFVPYFKSKGIPFLQYEDFLKERGFMVGSLLVKVIFTPGHTSDSVCFLIENNLFTGDTLFVKGVGTTNYGGNEEKLEESLNLLETLDSKIKMWPGHNYGGKNSLLGKALRNSHVKPNKEFLKDLHKRISDYENKK